MRPLCTYCYTVYRVSLWPYNCMFSCRIVITWHQHSRAVFTFAESFLLHSYSLSYHFYLKYIPATRVYFERITGVMRRLYRSPRCRRSRWDQSRERNVRFAAWFSIPLAYAMQWSVFMYRIFTIERIDSIPGFSKLPKTRVCPMSRVLISRACTDVGNLELRRTFAIYTFVRGLYYLANTVPLRL